jgi:DNA invertase Pin-like site-specific DNA recombinase
MQIPVEPKAYSYVRMSSDARLRGDSLKRQVDRSIAYAATHQLKLDDEFKLHDIGVSAFDGSNILTGQLGLFLRAVDEGKIAKGSYLLVESLDRLSREDALSALGTFLRLLNAGISIVTLSDSKCFVPEKTEAMDLIYSLLIMSRAHEESLIKSDRVASAWKTKRANARTQKLTARCPAWLELSVDRSEFEVIENRRLVIERIFTDSANGMGSFAIARSLNKDRVPTFGTSKGWQYSYVRKILDNKAVIGEFQARTKKRRVRKPSGDPVSGYYPRIVSDELFYRAKAATAQRRGAGGGRKGPNVSNLFSKLAICGMCFRPMRYVDKGRKGGQRLVCDGSLRGLGCPSIHGWNYKEFETSFLFFVKEVNLPELFARDGNDSRLIDVNDRLMALTGEIQDKVTKRDITYNLLLNSKFPGQTLEEKYAELEGEIDQLQKVRESLAVERDELVLTTYRLQESEQELIPLIDSVQQSNLEERYKWRERIAFMLSTIIEVIKVFPAGLTWSDQKTQDIKRKFLDSGLDKEQIDHYFTNFVNAGLKRPKAHRFFSVGFKDGTIRIVKPDPSDPTKYLYYKKYSLSMGEMDEIESSAVKPNRETTSQLYPDLSSDYIESMLSHLHD